MTSRRYLCHIRTARQVIFISIYFRRFCLNLQNVNATFAPTFPRDVCAAACFSRSDRHVDVKAYTLHSNYALWLITSLSLNLVHNKNSLNENDIQPEGRWQRMWTHKYAAGNVLREHLRYKEQTYEHEVKNIKT